jgi:hypothetical protein
MKRDPLQEIIDDLLVPVAIAVLIVVIVHLVALVL